jgi:hypothetical protein
VADTLHHTLKMLAQLPEQHTHCPWNCYKCTLCSPARNTIAFIHVHTIFWSQHYLEFPQMVYTSWPAAAVCWQHPACMHPPELQKSKTASCFLHYCQLSTGNRTAPVLAINSKLNNRFTHSTAREQQQQQVGGGLQQRHLRCSNSTRSHVAAALSGYWVCNSGTP